MDAFDTLGIKKPQTTKQQSGAGNRFQCKSSTNTSNVRPTSGTRIVELLFGRTRKWMDLNLSLWYVNSNKDVCLHLMLLQPSSDS